MHLSMQVGENELETGSSSGGHPADLVQCPIAVQDILDPNTIKVASQKEVDLVIVLCS